VEEGQARKRLVTDIREHAGQHARGDVPEMLNTIFMVLILAVPNGNNHQTSNNQCRALCSDDRYWEKLIAFVEKKCGLKEP